ncbi:MAG: copper chaperone PCu(A)C [Micromonosporaceae bacterium]
MRLTTSGVRRASALILAGAVVALAGCSAGQNAQTAAKEPSVPGAHADLDGLALRNAQIAYADREHRSYPKGGNAPLDVRIFNTGDTPDSLVSVSSEVADSVVLVGAAAETSEICPEAAVSVPTKAAPSPTATGSPTGSPSPTPAAPAEKPGAGSAEFTIALAPGSCALLQADQPYHLELSGLHEEIAPGGTVPITFRFAEAGEVTLDVPFGMPHDGAEHSPVNMHPEEPHVVGGGPKHE